MKKLYFVKLNCCPVCKSKETKLVYSCNYLEPPIIDYLKSFYGSKGNIDWENLRGSSYILNECFKCGLIYQEQIPNELFMKKIYNEYITPNISQINNTELLFKKNIAYAQEIMITLNYFKTINRKLKLLDFGMGWGRWCSMAKAFGCDVYGTELSESRIKYAKSMGIKLIDRDEILNYKFDFINTEQVFEHISSPLETLKYLSNSLNQHGLIKISVPDGVNIKKRLKRLDWSARKGDKYSLNLVSPLEHINCFKRATLIKMADLAGLELAKIPIFIQLAYTSNWNGVKQIIKNIGKPFYRNLLKRGTYLFFKKKNT